MVTYPYYLNQTHNDGAVRGPSLMFCLGDSVRDAKGLRSMGPR